MIGVTDRAKEELKNILDNNADDKELGLRLVTNEQGQIGIALDKERPGDNVVEHKGSKVLLVENAMAPHLVGIAIDIEDTPEGPILAIVSDIEPDKAEGPN